MKLHFKLALLVFPVFLSAQVASAHINLTFCCKPDSDLFVTLKKQQKRLARYENAGDAIKNAAVNSSVLILADGYPAQRTPITGAELELAKTKNLRLFVEFPEAAAFPELTFGQVQKTVWERGVVASDAFGSTLPKFRILAVHDCHFLPVKAANPLLVIARVAGFDIAPYGLPANASPLLFEIPDRKIFVATTKLSNFITARYAPAEDWNTLWKFILAKLDPDNAPFELEWTPVVTPAFSANERLPRRFERKALQAASDWIVNSRLLVPPSRVAEIKKAFAANQETGPTPSENIPADGSLGILEGYASGILHDGNQIQRLPLRADCHAESAMVLALDGTLDRNKERTRIAANLLDYVYFKSDMCVGARADPKHSAFGLIAWGGGAPAWLVANYGDDNARTILGTILTAASLKDKRWNEPVAKALLANFRTTGKLGFRGDRIDMPTLDQNRWQNFYNAEPVNYSPHFESGLWACNLWAYRATGFRPFYDRATNAIAMTMKVYPGWRWGDNMERARMMLCLSWLVRLEDTPQHREWLMRVTDDLLKRQQPNGAIHDWLGGAGGGHYVIPQSNEAYGTGETPLIQQNGDPASDQLYTTGFALLALHEAVAATGDKKLRIAKDKLAEFLCRIQTKSEKIPYVDGWWFRAFDDRRWEFWASSADVGWGAWSLEAGWAQAWTAATLALREMKTTFWDFTETVDISKDFEKWMPQMLETSGTSQKK